VAYTVPCGMVAMGTKGRATKGASQAGKPQGQGPGEEEGGMTARNSSPVQSFIPDSRALVYCSASSLAFFFESSFRSFSFFHTEGGSCCPLRSAAACRRNRNGSRKVRRDLQ
jgi:hypothetical protein